MKAQIKVRECEEESEEEDIEEQPQNAVPKPTPGFTPGGPDDNQDESQENAEEEEDKEKAVLVRVSKQYPFDITHERFLKLLLSNVTHFKVRLYLLTCQNLSAIDSHIELKSKLAGLKALCSADPFPVISVGDGVNNQAEQKVKYINERDREVSQDLNPKFYRHYEFDANFPDDWKLEIKIYDKGSLAYTDALIG